MNFVTTDWEINGMLQHLDANSISNQVRMLRTVARDEVIVLVEDAASCRVLTNTILNKYTTKVVPAHRKVNVYDALARVPSDSRLIGIADADYERLAGSRPPRRCFWFDHRDLEVMLICSAAFDRVITELCPGAGTDTATLRQDFLDACLTIGQWRAASARAELRLSFVGLRPDTMYDPQARTFNVAMFITWIRENNPGCPSEIVQLSIRSADSRDLVRGHDMSALIASYIAHYCGRLIGAAEFETYLRLAAEFDDIESSQLVSDLRQWEVNNDAQVLRD